MRRLILGTAGHIDHGKTALVRALTGTDTDRLKEEKERGITIELGFAELGLGEVRFGVVDVPGHEAFVRAMVAGAAGIDVVLLVIAADEGVMPQTREHLAIVDMLDVAHAVVALTKCDTVEAEWLDLVEADVRDALASTRYAEAPVVATSSVTEEGLDTLRAELAAAGHRAAPRSDDDLLRLPLDRVFTIQGTGTVVTGTLWSGRVAKGDRVRVEPMGLDARVRGVQVHDAEVREARAGDRAAVALTGAGGDRDRLERGATLVGAGAWTAAWMLTARVTLLVDTGWSLVHNQRVRAHVGTAEVLARVALLEERALQGGDTGWVQLRLEEPVIARARDRLIIRAYSPVTTIGGGQVAEPTPAKRRRLDASQRDALALILDGEPAEGLDSVIALASWQGVARSALPVLSGLRPALVESTLELLDGESAVTGGGRVFTASVRSDGKRALLARIEALHSEDALRAHVPLAAVRTALPPWAAPGLADALIAGLVDESVVERSDGGVRLAGHRAELTGPQERASARLRGLYREHGLAAPLVEELPDELTARDDLWSLLKHLEGQGAITPVADGYYVDADVLRGAIADVRAALGGRAGLGPADFRDVLPVTRKHLIPLLNHLDGLGVTLRTGDGREVP